MSFIRTGELSEPDYSQQTSASKHDVLNREKLPGDLDEIAVREPVEAPSESAAICARALLAVSWKLCAYVILLRIAGSEIGEWVISRELLALWFGVGLFRGARRFINSESTLSVLEAILTPLLIPVVFALEHLAKSDPKLAFGVGVLALFFCADQIANHFHLWLTAHAGMGEREREELRTAWRRRFASAYLLNFAVAAVPFALVVKGFPAGLLVVLMPLIGIAWALRPRTVGLDWGIRGSLRALTSFLSWGRWEGPFDSKTPGVFRSPAGPITLRWGLTLGTIGALSICFSPPFDEAAAMFERGDYPRLLTWVLNAVFLPLVLLVSTLMIVAGRELATTAEDLEWQLGEEDGTACFRQITARLRSSDDEVTRENHYLGKHYHLRYPVFLPRRLLKDGHGKIGGGTGTGKTSRGLLPLVLQEIERNDCAVILLDLKFTNFFLQALRKASGSRFKVFTNEPGKATYVFNPFTQLQNGTTSVNQICEILLDALRLAHGEGYGRSYFSRTSRIWLSEVLHAYPNLKSFHELFEILRREPPKGSAGADERRIRSECTELLSVAQSLASCDALNWGHVPGARPEALRDQIILKDVIEQNGVLYVSLPMSRESITAREIANLFVFLLFEVARETSKKGHKVLLVIDEFPWMASRQFERILREARGFGISILLSYQSEADLQTEDAPNLAAVVEQNTVFKQYFSLSEPEVQDILLKSCGLATSIQHSASVSGLESTPIFETRRTLVTDSNGHKWVAERRLQVGSAISKVRKGELPVLGETFTATPMLVPRWNINDLLSYSADPEASIVRFDRDSGYSQYGGLPFVIRSPFAMSLREKDELEAMEWPKPTPSTIVAGVRSRLYRSFFKYQGSPQNPVHNAQPTQAPSRPPNGRPQQRSNPSRPKGKGLSPRPVAPSTPGAGKSKGFWKQRLQQISSKNQGGMI